MMKYQDEHEFLNIMLSLFASGGLLLMAVAVEGVVVKVFLAFAGLFFLGVPLHALIIFFERMCSRPKR